MESNYELTHDEKVYIFAFGSLEGLVSKGLLEGPKPLTQQGRDDYEALKASGFKPGTAELMDAVKNIMHGEY